MIISKQLQSDLFDSSVMIESQFELSIITSCDRLPQSFKDSFEDDAIEICAAMGLAWDGNYNESDNDDVTEFIRDNNRNGCLVKVCTPVPNNFRFTESGDISSYSSSWGFYSTHYIYAESIEKCCELAIKWQEENTQKHAERERKSHNNQTDK